MDQKASESERVSTLNDLYALAEKNIVTSIQIFSEPNAQIDADPKLSGFYSTFVSVNHPHLKRNGELRKKAGRACRKAALAMIRPTQSVPELDEDRKSVV